MPFAVRLGLLICLLWPYLYHIVSALICCSARPCVLFTLASYWIDKRSLMKAFIWLSRGGIVFMVERLYINLFVQMSVCVYCTFECVLWRWTKERGSDSTIQTVNLSCFCYLDLLLLLCPWTMWIISPSCLSVEQRNSGFCSLDRATNIFNLNVFIINMEMPTSAHPSSHRCACYSSVPHVQQVNYREKVNVSVWKGMCSEVLFVVFRPFSSSVGSEERWRPEARRS